MNGPGLWTAILNRMRSIAPARYVVAGGCIRDFWLGLEPKDIDVFVDFADANDLRKLKNKLNASEDFDDVRLLNEDAEEYQVDDPYLLGVIEGEWSHSGQDWTVNIIARPALRISTLALAQTFDYGILQAWFDLATPGIQTTPACDFDRDELYATLMHGRHYEASRERFARFRRRNGDVLTFRNPKGYA